MFQIDKHTQQIQRHQPFIFYLNLLCSLKIVQNIGLYIIIIYYFYYIT